MRDLPVLLHEDEASAGLQVLLRHLQGGSVEGEEVTERSRQFMADGEPHKVYKRGKTVYVDHVEKDGGKHDVINLTKETGAKSVKAGAKAVKDYHSGKGPSYYPK